MFKPEPSGEAKMLNRGIDVLTIVAIVVLTIAVFVLDLMIPLGYAVWLLYFIPLLLAMSATRLNPFVFVTAVTILIVVGYFLSPSGTHALISIVNRGLGVFAIWVATLILMRQKQLEQTLQHYKGIERRKVDAVTQAASRYARSLIEASLDPLLTISTEGKITDVNKATEDVTGVKRDKLIGSDFVDYFTDPQKAREGYQQVFSQGSVTDYPLSIHHGSGKITDVLYNANLYRDAQGNALGIFAAARDITESKRLGEALQRRNIDLEKATALADEASLAKTNFLASMSHELRTPLNAILGFAQLLESSPSPLTPAQKTNIGRILTAGWHLLELVNEILDLAQIESGKVAISVEAVPLENVMNECLALVLPLANQRGIGVSLEPLDQPHYVHADRTRLRQVLINLLHNSIKYNKPAGTVTVNVESGITTSNSIRISVRDTGPGLSPEQIGQLFQPFNRLGQEAGSEQGTGIGLVVVQRLMGLMGGRVGVDSHVGVGSVFWIELNLTTALLPAIGEVDVDVRASPMPPDLSSHRTVLFVEDNLVNLALMEELIARRKDLYLISAVDGDLGVEYARTFLPAVILMDIHLPGISGIDAMKILRADPTTAHIPVIAVSAYASSSDIDLAMDAGFFNYITKPIKLNELMIALDIALRFSALRALISEEKLRVQISPK